MTFDKFHEVMNLFCSTYKSKKEDCDSQVRAINSGCDRARQESARATDKPEKARR